MVKHIPGEPTLVVKQMRGASGLKAANYIYNNAAKDGTELAGTHGHIPTIPIFRPQGVHYDPTKFNWIGSATREVYIGYVWHTSPVQSMEDARVKSASVGGQAVGSMSIDIAVLANAMMGTKFKIITGYSGSAETQLAVERGELQGHFGTTWTNISTAQPAWLKEKKIKVIAQFGETKHRDLMDVPLLGDYVIKPEDKAALAAFLARQETGKPYFAPPGVPAERLALLRKAFNAAIKDKDYLAEMAKAGLDVLDPMTGEDIDAYVAKYAKTPKSAADRINKIFTDYGASK
jgi:tripartite-type tricarboxylate transporter receptor subunit TctC